MRVGVGQIGMRIGRPGCLDDRARPAQFAGLAEQPSGQRGGRHQGRRELDGFERERAGAIAIVLLGGERLRGEQHRALAPVVGLSIRPLRCCARAAQRANPVAGRAAEFERRLAGPAERRRARLAASSA